MTADTTLFTVRVTHPVTIDQAVTAVASHLISVEHGLFNSGLDHSQRDRMERVVATIDRLTLTGVRTIVREFAWSYGAADNYTDRIGELESSFGYFADGEALGASVDWETLIADKVLDLVGGR